MNVFVLTGFMDGKRPDINGLLKKKVRGHQEMYFRQKKPRPAG